jgi:uncharacterized protein (DUF1697 family)
MRCVALLRGINVGGKHLVKMDQLTRTVEALGHKDVVTYLQSGNVVFTAGNVMVETLRSDIASSLEDTFGFEIPVVVRAGPAIRSVATAHPFADRAQVPKELSVLFLASEPSTTAVADLDPNRGGQDSFVVDGAEVYLHLESAARTKLSLPWFERQLGITGTVRNWNTVLALAELASNDA